MSAEDVTLTSHSPAETERVGEALGHRLRAGDVVLLSGELGAGKTVLVRGAARGLGVAGRVRSPTFVFVNEYAGPVRLLHVDLYRVPPGEGGELGLEDLAAGDAGPAATIVEWGERSRGRFPEDALEIALAPGAAPDERRLTLRARGPRSAALLAALAAETGAEARR